jgi:hypothetical protein
MPGFVMLAAAFALALAVGWVMGWPARDWWMYVGVMLAVVLGMGQGERLWARRNAPRPPRARGRLKVIPGGKAAYDLEEDDPSHRQRWLM